MSENSLRCPEVGCTGWISEVDDPDEHFWGCGECGNVWYEREELDEAIDDIISQFAYRKKVYRKAKGNWQPVPLEKEPEDYEERVESEEEDSGGEFDDMFLACPVSRCDGQVFHSGDEDGEYWICGTCDSRWFNQKNLIKEITAVIKQYPYRKKMYSKVEGGYEPVEWEGDILEYCDLVAKEPRDKQKGKKRG